MTCFCWKCHEPWRESYAPGFNNSCERCGMPLHACANCAHQRPKGAVRCALPVPPRILDPSDRNSCGGFQFRTIVEIASTAGDPRARWDSLFR